MQVVRVWPERGAVQVYNPKGEDKLFTYDAAYDCSADTQTIYDEMVSTSYNFIFISQVNNWFILPKALVTNW